MVVAVEASLGRVRSRHGRRSVRVGVVVGNRPHRTAWSLRSMKYPSHIGQASQSFTGTPFNDQNFATRARHSSTSGEAHVAHKRNGGRQDAGSGRPDESEAGRLLRLAWCEAGAQQQ